jgi:predicted membrane protein
MLDLISAILGLAGTFFVTYTQKKKAHVFGMILWIISCLIGAYYFAFIKVSWSFFALQISYIILSIHGIYIRRKKNEKQHVAQC